MPRNNEEWRGAIKLQVHAATSVASLRPLVTSLNGDNSWLFSFPRPENELKKRGKLYFHIIYEPWLAGKSFFLSTWFAQFTLAEKASFTTAEDVYSLIRHIERVSAEHLDVQIHLDEDNLLDAIAMTLNLADHLHPPTLQQFNKNVPVIASPSAASTLKSLDLFDNIHILQDIPDGCTNWNQPELHAGAFPPWLTLLRLPGTTELSYSLALIWSHTPDGGKEEIHETIIYSPHGTRVDLPPLATFLEAEPKTQKLAMFHPLKESYSMGWVQNVTGAKGGLELYRKIGGCKHWVRTHNGEIHYQGFLMKTLLVTDYDKTLESALDAENEPAKERPNLHTVGNGDLIALA